MSEKLRFILGPSGSGKSAHLYKELIKKSQENPESNFIFIVPEQFTMETQRKMVENHPHNAVSNIDIVSFNRLAFRVFSELGISKLDILDDTGKSLILRKVIANESKNLNIYKEKIHMHGFVEEMKSVISELYMYGIGLDKYGEIKKQVSNHHLITEKLNDIEVVYAGFQKFINDKFITKEELLEKLCQAVPESDMIKNSEIYFDEFTGFTPVQNQLMELLIKHSKGATVALTIGEEQAAFVKSGIKKGSIPVNEQELFMLPKETVNVLLKTYKQLYGEKRFAGVEEETVFLSGKDSLRFKQNETLKTLEQKLFRRNGETVENNGSVVLKKFANPGAEVEYVSDYIAYQVKNHGYRYRDFAVISGDIDGYGKVISDHFLLRDIPFFMDNKRSLILNPGVTFIRAILEVIDTDFSYESVFKFLKCGIEIMDADDVDLLENYVLACGVRGYKRYNGPFVAKKRRMSDEEAVKINEIRVTFMEATTGVYQSFREKKNTVKDMTTYLYEFMVAFQLESRLKILEEEFQEEGELSLSKEYGQTYGYIIDLFDKLVNLLGEEEMSLKEYREILDAGFEEIKVGVIPLGMDQVMVGDIERTRLNNVKMVLVIGANDGIIPKHSKKSSLLSQTDRNYLKKLDVELSPTLRESIFIQKFYLYLSLTKPSNKLILSYCESGSDGSALRPSYLVGEIERLYDKVEDEETKEFQETLKLSSKAFALKYLSQHLNRNKLNDMSDFVKELYGYFYGDEECRGILDKINAGVFFDNNPTRLSKKVAEQLAEEGVLKSVSRLEKYAACAYAHFLSYSLNLVEREKYQVNMADMGTLYHRCIELFSGEMTRNGLDFRSISEEDRDALMDTCVDKITENYGNTVLKSSKRNEYLIRKIKAVAKKTAWAMCEHIKRGQFNPENFEFSFKEGRIDRLDTYEKDGKLYIKIIDYKSGNKKFEMSDVFNGLQLQLVYYIGEAMKVKEAVERGVEIVPGGTFYFNIKSPYVECRETIEDSRLQELLLKEYRMTGLVNSEIVPAVAMDENLEEEKSESVIIPMKNKELGQVAAGSGLNQEYFKKMIDKVDEITSQFVEQILDGHIEKNPYVKSQITPCNYCSYKSICEFNPLEFKNENKKLMKIAKPEDVLAKLREDKEGEEA